MTTAPQQTASSAPTAAAARYAVTVHAIASAIAAELDGERLVGEVAWERADAALRRHRAGPHAWVFEDPETLRASQNVLAALEPGPDGPPAPLQRTLPFAAASVARFDVFSRLAELRDMGELDGDEGA